MKEMGRFFHFIPDMVHVCLAWNTILDIFNKNQAIIKIIQREKLFDDCIDTVVIVSIFCSVLPGDLLWNRTDLENGLLHMNATTYE